MDPLSVVSILNVVNGVSPILGRLYTFRQLYGVGGLPFAAYTSSKIWKLQAQVLAALAVSEAEDADGVATSFKRTILDECTMISVSVRPGALF